MLFNNFYLIEKYSSARRPPAELCDLLEGKKAADEVYQHLLESQILFLFENLLSMTVPSQETSKDEKESHASQRSSTIESSEASKSDKPKKHSRSKSYSRNEANQLVAKAKGSHVVGAHMLKESGNNPQILESQIGVKSVTVKEVQERMRFLIDEADSLMLVESLNWSSLFHLRYLLTNQTLKPTEIENMKKLTEVFMENTLSSADNQIRRLASRLMQYLVSHSLDIDGCLIGMRPSSAIESKLENAVEKVNKKIFKKSV